MEYEESESSSWKFQISSFSSSLASVDVGGLVDGWADNLKEPPPDLSGYSFIWTLHFNLSIAKSLGLHSGRYQPSLGQQELPSGKREFGESRINLRAGSRTSQNWNTMFPFVQGRRSASIMWLFVEIGVFSPEPVKHRTSKIWYFAILRSRHGETPYLTQQCRQGPFG